MSMSNLSKLVQEVKALIKNEEPTVVMHTEDENIDVTFFVATEGEIAPGVKAEPDGTFTLSNGVKVTIENGEVVSLEAEVEVPDSVIEGQKNEEGEPSQEPAPQEPTELEKTPHGAVGHTAPLGPAPPMPLGNTARSVGHKRKRAGQLHTTDRNSADG